VDLLSKRAGLMRRSMLTAQSTVAIAVGQASGSTNENNGNIHVSVINPANAGGTLTTVSANFNVLAARNVAFFTCDTSFVVRAISTSVSSVAGQSSYAVSLAVQTGDYIGLWIADANFVNPRYAAGSSSYWRNGTLTAAKPTAGATLSGLTQVTSRDLNLSGAS
jgi:hypothetical protein